MQNGIIKCSHYAVHYILLTYLLLKKIFLMFIYYWETDTEREQGRGRERGGDTESEAGSRLRAISTEPDTGLELTNCEIMTWAEVGRLTNWATQAPLWHEA